MLWVVWFKRNKVLEAFAVQKETALLSLCRRSKKGEYSLYSGWARFSVRSCGVWEGNELDRGHKTEREKEGQ